MKKKHVCITCGHKDYKKGVDNPVKYESDPYDDEILDIKKKDWYCLKCLCLSGDEI